VFFFITKLSAKQRGQHFKFIKHFYLRIAVYKGSYLINNVQAKLHDYKAIIYLAKPRKA